MRMSRRKIRARLRKKKIMGRLFSMLFTMIFIMAGNGFGIARAEVEKLTVDVTGEIIWLEDAPAGAVSYLQLYQGAEALGNPVKLVGTVDKNMATNGSGEASAWKYTWIGLDLADTSSANYKYTVKEVDQSGADFTPEGYAKTEIGLVVTNEKIKAENTETAASQENPAATSKTAASQENPAATSKTAASQENTAAATKTAASQENTTAATETAASQDNKTAATEFTDYSEPPLTFSKSSTANTPWVMSEMADYHPGDTVNITGGGWRGDKKVKIFISDTDVVSTWNIEKVVPVAVDGSIQFAATLPLLLVEKYNVVVTGVTTGRIATTTFTDSQNQSGGSTYIVDPSTPDTSLLPGQIKITKEASVVPGKVNTWDIKLRVVGRNKSVTSDIVLVIDRSGSMTTVGSDGRTRIQAAKDAANSFVDNVLAKDPVNTRISVVSFAGLVNNTGNTADLTLDSNFTNTAATIHTAINSLKANGGTLTQAALIKAQDMLSGSSATKKTIILLSDGEPTYSYAINNLSKASNFTSYNQTYLCNSNYDSSNTATVNIPYVTSASLPQSRYNYTISNGTITGTVVGYGDASFCRAFNNTNDSTGSYYYSHGNSTVAQASYIKATGQTIYTISLYAGDYGTSVLNSVASPGRAYSSDTAGLTAVFQQIAGMMGSAVSSASVTDPMASGFFINDNKTIIPSSGTTAYDAGTKILTWNCPSLTQVLDSSHTDIKYEQLTYRIKISGDTPTDAVSYPTNGTTPMTFYDVDGAYCTNNFPVPTVDPVFVTVYKVLLDEYGNPKSSTDQFTINLSGDNFSQNVLVTPGDNNIVTLKQVWDVGTYNISESPSSLYTTTIAVNGVQQNTINLAIGGEDQNNVVTNREKVKPSLVILKVDGTTQLPLQSAVFALYKGDANGPSGDQLSTVTTGADGKAVFQTLSNGTYWLVETQKPSGYQWINDPIGPFTVANSAITGPAAYTLVEDGTTSNYIVTITNQAIRELPKAGGMGTTIFTIAGLSLMMYALLWRKEKKKTRMYNKEG